MSPKDELRKILPLGNYTRLLCKCHGNDIILIDYGSMYEAPEVNFQTQLKLVEFFGANDIKLEAYSFGGCETCDYGSLHGNYIEILGCTKNTDLIMDHGG